MYNSGKKTDQCFSDVIFKTFVTNGKRKKKKKMKTWCVCVCAVNIMKDIHTVIFY